MKRYQLTPAAEADLGEIIEYIRSIALMPRFAS